MSNLPVVFTRIGDEHSMRKGPYSQYAPMKDNLQLFEVLFSSKLTVKCNQIVINVHKYICLSYLTSIISRIILAI